MSGSDKVDPEEVVLAFNNYYNLAVKLITQQGWVKNDHEL